MEARTRQEAAASAALPEAKAAAARAAELVLQDDAAAMEASSSSEESSDDDFDVKPSIPSSAPPKITIKQEDEGRSDLNSRSIYDAESTKTNTAHGQQQHLQHQHEAGLHDRGPAGGTSMAVHLKQEANDPEEQATHHGNFSGISLCQWHWSSITASLDFCPGLMRCPAGDCTLLMSSVMTHDMHGQPSPQMLRCLSFARPCLAVIETVDVELSPA